MTPISRNSMFLMAVLVLCGCGCQEQSNEPIVAWGDCGPVELDQEAPAGVLQAAEEAILPGGNVYNNSGYGCEPDEQASFGAAYLTGYLIEEKADKVEDDFIDFGGGYIVILYCDEYPSVRLHISYKEETETWKCVGYSGSGLIGILDQALGNSLSGCSRGIFHTPHEWASFGIVTQFPNQTLIYPLIVQDSYIWEDYPDAGAGDVFWTKEEFFEWWQSTGTHI